MTRTTTRRADTAARGRVTPHWPGDWPARSCRRPPCRTFARCLSRDGKFELSQFFERAAGRLYFDRGLGPSQLHVLHRRPHDLTDSEITEPLRVCRYHIPRGMVNSRLRRPNQETMAYRSSPLEFATQLTSLSQHSRPKKFFDVAIGESESK